jgi:hypothetical protein
MTGRDNEAGIEGVVGAGEREGEGVESARGVEGEGLVGGELLAGDKREGGGEVNEGVILGLDPFFRHDWEGGRDHTRHKDGHCPAIHCVSPRFFFAQNSTDVNIR